MVGAGFVIARFGLLLKEIGLRQSVATTPGLSLWFGTALVFVGGIVGPLAGAAYRSQLSRLNESLGMNEKPAVLGMILCSLLSAVGLGMAAYLIATRA